MLRQDRIDLWEQFGGQSSRQRLDAIDAQELLTLNGDVVGHEGIDRHE
jgi:hypothetical protein